MAAGQASPIDRLVSIWRSEPSIGGNIVEWHSERARPALLCDYPEDLHPALRAALERRGIRQLYSHQTESWEIARDGKNLVVVTGTASGKTLCYNLPVLDAALRDPQATALYLFPTKALTQDQRESVSGLIEDVRTAYLEMEQVSPFPEIPVSVYDGDTPSSHRSAIRTRARLLMTNPDMLHMGILPHHTLWAEYLRKLRFIVIDELHVYRGVFGSHIANLMRRLKRIARFYGANPQFILTSATIANPVELAERLVEEPVARVENDGSPRGPRHFALYNPPVVEQRMGIRRSSMVESVRLVDDLLAYNVQTLIFARTRRSVELVLRNLQYKQAGQGNEIHGYRSGYLPKERRAIERGLRAGETRAVVTTNALELGVDIGNAGAVVLVGYPGTIAGTRQQSGRAGRRQESSLTVLIASAGPLDQFLMQHPEYLFENSPERALINPDNLLILLQHLRCAAFELPFQAGECFGRTPPEVFEELLQLLQQAGMLHESRGRYFWTSDQYPANTVSLRSTSVGPFLLQAFDGDRWETVGEVDGDSVYWMAHPNAIYIHEGRTFEVEELLLEEKRAHLKPVTVDYFTEPRQQDTIEKISQLGTNPIQGGQKAYGEVMVTSQVVGYRKLKWFSHEVLGEYSQQMPPSHLRTIGYWLSLNEASVERLRDLGLWNNDPNDYGANWNQQRRLARERDDFTCQICGARETTRQHHVHHRVPFRNFTSALIANQLDNLITLCPTCHKKAETAIRMRSGLAGLSYVLQHMSPLFVMCDVGDLGVQFDPQSSMTDGQPTVVLYDRLPAGIGLSENLFQIHDELMQHCYELVTGCPCQDGCPGCVGPAGENGASGKVETIAVLAILTGKAL